MEPAHSHLFDQPHHNVSDDDDNKAVESKPPEVIIPPFWQHQRGQSFASVISNGKPPPITLEDHTEESYEQTSPLWAKVVSIQNHVVVSGNVTGVGDYVVWICKVDTLDVSFHFCPPDYFTPKPFHLYSRSFFGERADLDRAGL